MPFLIKTQRKWLENHGEQKNGEGWVCKETGEPINSKSFQHSTANPCFGPVDFLAGRDGNPTRRSVLMLYCTACDEEPERLPRGLTGDEIVEVR